MHLASTLAAPNSTVGDEVRVAPGKLLAASSARGLGAMPLTSTSSASPFAFRRKRIVIGAVCQSTATNTG